MIIAGWIVWGLSLWWFVGTLLINRKCAKNGMPIHISLHIQLILLFFSIIVFAVSTINKLHLLWVVPSCYLIGFIIGFIVVPLPLIGDILWFILSIFAHIFFFGTDWILGGYPWEVLCARRFLSSFKIDHYHTLDEFEAAILERERLLFGYYLYYQMNKYIYNHNKDIMEYNEFYYEQIKEYTEKAVLDAKILLSSIKIGDKNVDNIRKFILPPIHGKGLSKTTEMAKVLVNAYDRKFPDRPYNIDMNEKEILILIQVTSYQLRINKMKVNSLIWIRIISILFILYGILEIVDSLPMKTDKIIEIGIPLLGIMLLTSGVGMLFLKEWSRKIALEGCVWGSVLQFIGFFYSSTLGIFIGIIFLFLFYKTFIYLYSAPIKNLFIKKAKI